MAHEEKMIMGNVKKASPIGLSIGLAFFAVLAKNNYLFRFRTM